MRIETTLTFKEYLKLMYILTYRKGWMIFILIIGIVMFVGSTLYFLGFEIPADSPPYFQIVFGFFIIFLMPISVYFSAKRNYTSQQRLKEKIIYEFTNEKIIINGESFHSELDWDKTFRVQELNGWILIYQSRLTANILTKESFGEHLAEFKSLVRSKNIKSNLKK